MEETDARRLVVDCHGRAPQLPKAGLHQSPKDSLDITH